MIASRLSNTCLRQLPSWTRGTSCPSISSRRVVSTHLRNRNTVSTSYRSYEQWQSTFSVPSSLNLTSQTTSVGNMRSKAGSSGKGASKAPVLAAKCQGGERQKQKSTDSNRDLHVQRMYRLARGGNSRSQKTLTQIDFIHAAGRGAPDEGSLDYIEDGQQGKGSAEEELDCAAKEKKAKPKKKPGQRRNSLGRFARDTDDTLTQMGFMNTCSKVDLEGQNVRAPEPKEVQLREPNGRYNTRPRRNAATEAEVAFKMETIPEEPSQARGDDQVDYLCDEHESSSRKRRKLNDGAKQPSPELFDPINRPASRTAQAASLTRFSQSRSPSETPVTPHKPRRLVIPSSQSPDSPDIMLNNPTFHSSPIRFPLTDISRNVAPQSTPKRGSSELVPAAKACPLPQLGTGFQSSTVPSSQSSTQSQVPGNHDNMETTPATSPPPHTNEEKGHGENLPKKTKDRTNTPVSDKVVSRKQEGYSPEEDVIYETDTQSEVDWFYDASSHISGDRDTQNIQESQHRLSDRKSQPSSESDILRAHRHPSSSNVLETYNNTRRNQLGSDNSMFYYRRPMNTLHDPSLAELRAIGPDKMAELFPDSGPEHQQEEAAEPSLPAIPTKSENPPPPTQTSTRDPADISTEFVPDSSQPVPPLSGTQSMPQNQAPPVSSPSVVLVESSQNNKDRDADLPGSTDSQGLPPRGMLTASQLLPDSLMESIPSPPIWVSSQGQLQEEGPAAYHQKSEN